MVSKISIRKRNLPTMCEMFHSRFSFHIQPPSSAPLSHLLYKLTMAHLFIFNIPLIPHLSFSCNQIETHSNAEAAPAPATLLGVRIEEFESAPDQLVGIVQF